MKTTRVSSLNKIMVSAENQRIAGYSREQALTWLLSFYSASLHNQVDYDRVKARVYTAVKTIYGG